MGRVARYEKAGASRMGSTHFSLSSGGYVVSDIGVCMNIPGVMVTDRMP